MADRRATPQPDTARPRVAAVVARRDDALARGNRIGALLVSALLATFAAQRSLDVSWSARVPWPVVTTLVWIVSIGGALYAMRPPHHAQSGSPLRIESFITAVAAATTVAMLGLDLPPDARFLHGAVIALMAGFALLMPLDVRFGGLLIAVVALTWPAVELIFGGAVMTDPEFVLRLIDLSAGAALSLTILAVHNALFERRYRALADSARLADEDALTGVLNRRSLVAWLQVECERARRYDRRIGVVLFDIDQFKSFNTRLGYLAGDTMLREVARTLEGVLQLEHFARRGATVGRYGGEEFVMVLPGADDALVRRLAEETRAAIAARRVPWAGELLQVTVSVGATVTAGADAHAANLIAAADRAMYASKQAHGDRVTLAETLPEDAPLLHARGTLDMPRGHIIPDDVEAADAIDDAVRLQTALLVALLRVAAVFVLLYAGVDVALHLHPDWTIDLKRVFWMRGIAATAGLALAAVVERLPRTPAMINTAHAILVGAATCALLLIEDSVGLPVPNFFSGMVLVVLSWAIAFAAPTALSFAVLSTIVVGYTGLTVATIEPGASLPAALMRCGVLGSTAVVAFVARGSFTRLRRDERVLRRRLQSMARLDPLTGLPNRATFEKRLLREQARAERNEQPLCIALIDLDHFKALNTRAGHLAGDAALVALADTFAAVLRAPDSAARLGGEEFAVMLVETDVDGAVAAMDRLQNAIRSTCLNGAPNGLRASIGLVKVRPAEAVDGALTRADEALREAKAAGRDRLVVHTG